MLSSKPFGLILTESQLHQFDMYMELLLEYNQYFNLTAITQPNQIQSRHFLDCLSCVQYIPEGSVVADVGSGAGFPGMVIKIARPDIKITLMDALNKRIGFLQTVAQKLELHGVECVHIRAEDAGKEPSFRETFDVVTSRAVAGMNILSEYSLPLVRPGGIMIAMKSTNAPKETQEAMSLISALGGGNVLYNNYTLPNEDITQTIVCIEKIRTTPSNYPRRAKRVGIIS